MIEINCDTYKEAEIIRAFIARCILNSSNELIKEACNIVGLNLTLNYNIKENKNKIASTNTLKINEYNNIIENKVGE